MDEYMTVELTLDNDEVVECAILTLFEAGGKEYIALLPLNEDGETEDGDVYLYRYTEDANGEPELEISKMTMNMRSLPMLSTNGWIPRNSKNQATMNSSFTKREGLRLFPFFSFT